MRALIKCLSVVCFITFAAGCGEFAESPIQSAAAASDVEAPVPECRPGWCPCGYFCRPCDQICPNLVTPENATVSVSDDKRQVVIKFLDRATAR